MKNLPYLLSLFILIACSSKEDEQPTIKATPKLTKWEDAVFYQIFPERFANGDTTNDPTFADTQGGWPDIFFDSATTAHVAQQWQVHPWNSDWYQLQEWESGIQWENIFDWANPRDPNVKGYLAMRRYGGDLQGIINRIDYLQDLGITALYLNPMFESPSLHKYDASMYHHIDNNFGPNPAKDKEIWATEDFNDPATWKWTTADSLFLQLIEECHHRGMRIIIDGVFNHTGTTFWAFQDVPNIKKNQPIKTGIPSISLMTPVHLKMNLIMKAGSV